MKLRILLGCVLFLLTACGPMKTVAAPVIAENSACSKTHPGTNKNNWGLSYIALGPSDFEDQVYCILNDDRSWAGIHQAKPGTSPDFIVREINETNVAELCGKPYPTEAENDRVSCATYDGRYVNINKNKMAQGIDWTIMVVNHEVGHELGFDHNFGSPCSVMHDAGCPVHPGAIWPPLEQRKAS